MYRQCILLYLFMLITSQFSHAQCLLSGNVQDSTGRGLAYLTISMQGETGAAKTAYTDTTGSFSIPQLTAGSYQLKVLHQQQEVYVNAITLLSDTSIHIIISNPAARTLQDVTITAQKKLFEKNI